MNILTYKERIDIYGYLNEIRIRSDKLIFYQS